MLDKFANVSAKCVRHFELIVSKQCCLHNAPVYGVITLCLYSLYQEHSYLFKRTFFRKVASPYETRVHHDVIFNEFTKSGFRQGQGSLPILSTSHLLVTLSSDLKVRIHS